MGHAIHDFTAKLRQPAVLPLVMDYVKWRRACREAEAAGQELPAAPAIAPISINLDLTTACNFRCDHCIDWDILNTPKHRHDEDDAEAPRSGTMTERGLRSRDPDRRRRAHHLSEASVDFVRFLKTDLEAPGGGGVSNGSRRRQAASRSPTCLDEPRDWVRLSLDAGSNEHVHRAMHKPVKKVAHARQSICAWIPKHQAAVNPRLPATATQLHHRVAGRVSATT